MLNAIRIFIANKVIGKDIRIVTLNTKEKIEYETHRHDGSTIFETIFK